MRASNRLIALLLLLSYTLLFLFGCGADTDTYITNIPIVPTPGGGYDHASKAALADRLTAALDAAVRRTYGDRVPDVFSDMHSTFIDAISVFSSGGIPLTSADDIVSEIESDTDTLDLIITAYRDGSPMPLSAMLMLFGKLSDILGVGTTASVIYELSLVWCDSRAEKYLVLFDRSPSLTYLREEAHRWQSYGDELRSVGQANFASLLRLGVSLTGLLTAQSNAADLLTSLSEGELMLFLRTLSDILDGLTLDRDGICFVLTLLSDMNVSPVFRAMHRTGDTQRWLDLWHTLLPVLSDILRSPSGAFVAAISQADPAETLYTLLRQLDVECITRLQQVLATEDTDIYREYYSTEAQAFEALVSSASGTTPEQLCSASREDYYTRLRDWLCSVAPGLAFGVYEL